jgi:excinuclease ABC subunit C
MKIQEKINQLPDSPGVYLMHNSAGDIVYVGKATSLKERVRSYYSQPLPVKTELQMREVVDIEYIETDSALEALFLEAKLIKKYSPKYNIKDKDDKSRIYVHIAKEDFPRIHFLRETDLPQIREKNPVLYGPFLSGRSVADALELIRKIVPFRTCNEMPKKKCLYGYLGLCEAPCEKLISKVEYRKRIRQVRDFFEGKKIRVLSSLKREMKMAAKNHDFEKAAKVRDHIYALEHLKRMFIREGNEQSVFWRIEGYDISNISGAYATGSMVVFIDGMSEKSEYRKFRIRPYPLSLRATKGSAAISSTPNGDVGMIKQVLERRFHNDWPHPDLILIDGGRGQVNVAVSVLTKLNLDIPVIGLAKGPDRKKDELITSRTLPRQDIKLFKEVRDEAHRFAKGYYEKLHRKNLI